MIYLFEGPTRLGIKGDTHEIRRIADELKFRPKGYEHSPKFQAFLLTDGQEGWDGYISPIRFERDGRGAMCLRGHKDYILKIAQDIGVQVDIRDCIRSPFADLRPDDIPEDLIEADFELDQYQRESVAFWLRHGMGVNKIAVNGGKTAMFAAAAAMIKTRFGQEGRCLYITQSERLVRQAYKDIKSFLPGWDITQYGGSRHNRSGNDMVIATVAMLWTHHQELVGDKWFESFIAVLYDESHHVAAETSSNLMMLLPAYFRLGASDTKKENNEGKVAKIRGLLGPIRHTVPVGVYIDIGRSAKPYIYIIENKKWRNRYEDLPHQAIPGSPAWALVGNDWREGVYHGPVYERKEDGEYKLVKKKELVGVDEQEVTNALGDVRVDKSAQWEDKMVPVPISGLHTLRFAGDEEFYEVSSDYCLLERVSDKAIIRFRQRNEMILEWTRYFACIKRYPTLVVCTRTLHVLILEALLKKHLGAKRIQVLVGEHTSKERDTAFDWFRNTPGGVLISPLVQEGVSINEIRGGVIADYVGDWERANQIIGRFIRKKQGDNEAHIAWFNDLQHPSLRRGCKRVIDRLMDIRGYTFYDPVLGPETIGRANVYEKLD